MNNPTLNVGSLKKKQQQYLDYQLEIYKAILNQCYRQIEIENQKSHTSIVFNIPSTHKNLDYPYENLCRYMVTKLREQPEITCKLLKNWRDPKLKQLYISWGDAFIRTKKQKKRRKIRQQTPYIKSSSIPKDVHKLYS